ncbi:hypothetical protein AX16_006312 [Volvariella volvacea WC 439]|nr:hypothetical protein AX16_006312 [Volvariella volvacea WC 439]
MADANTTTDAVRYTLISLLESTPKRLAYSLPLLFLSLTSAFAGTFLTLDRTRSFPSHHSNEYNNPLKNKSLWDKISSWYPLQGGLGGLISGFLFGLHLSTFLSLVIPARSPTMAPLSSSAFLAVWLLSSVATTLAGGRHRLPATIFTGISGGATFAVSLCVMIHPSLQSRLIFVGICMPLFLILCVIPFERTWRFSLRLANASTGSFGVTLAISLLRNIKAWGNVWERLWVKDHLEWGGSHEQGLSAGWCLMMVAGVAVDWLLHKKIGECPDQEWDAYLANYAYSLPNQVDRAGTFQPKPPTFWDRLLGRNTLTPGIHWHINPRLLKTAPPQSIHTQDTLTNHDSPYHKIPSLDNTLTNSNIPSRTRGLTTTTNTDTNTTPVDELDFKNPPPSASPSLAQLPGFLTKPNKLGKKKRKGLGGIATGFRKSSSGSASGSSATRSGSHSGSSGGLGGGRKPVKFKPLGDLSSDEASSGEESGVDLGGTPTKPWMHHANASGSTPTLVGAARPTTKAPKAGSVAISSRPGTPVIQNSVLHGVRSPPPLPKSPGPVEYSDYEEDLTNLRHSFGDRNEGRGDKWTPRFMSRQNTQTVSTVPTSPVSPRPPLTTSPPPMPIPSPAPAPASVSSPGRSPAKPFPVPMPIPVPATPSLIRAIDRINAAHKTALVSAVNGNGSGSPSSGPIPSSSSSSDRRNSRSLASPVQPRVHDSPPEDDEIDGPEERDLEGGDHAHGAEGAKNKTKRRWQEFWEDVKDRARQQ